jgi:hypothetical protein
MVKVVTTKFCEQLWRCLACICKIFLLNLWVCVVLSHYGEALFSWQWKPWCRFPRLRQLCTLIYWVCEVCCNPECGVTVHFTTVWLHISAVNFSLLLPQDLFCFLIPEPVVELLQILLGSGRAKGVKYLTDIHQKPKYITLLWPLPYALGFPPYSQ